MLKPEIMDIANSKYMYALQISGVRPVASSQVTMHTCHDYTIRYDMGSLTRTRKLSSLYSLI